MRISYDPDVDILMIRLDDTAGRRAKVQKLGGGALADISEDGTILALEIQEASKRYPLNVLLGSQATYGPMSLAEASKRSGISAQALRKACEEGRMKGEKIGRNWAVTADALIDYRDGRKHGGPGSADRPEAMAAG